MSFTEQDILWEHGSIILVNKPGGLLTQAPPGIDSLELRIKQFLIVRENKPGKAYLGVPHRLDRPVSGIMVVTKNVRAARRISEQIRERTVSKKYWALVSGNVAKEHGESGQWTDWMRKVPDEARSEVVAQDHADAKKAVLNYKVLRVDKLGDDEVSHLEIELITGRTHQIRLQCGHRQFPILGDALYGSTQSFGPQTADQRKRWIALHSRSLGLTHPMDKFQVDQTCPLPKHWLVAQWADWFQSFDC